MGNRFWLIVAGMVLATIVLAAGLGWVIQQTLLNVDACLKTGETVLFCLAGGGNS